MIKVKTQGFTFTFNDGVSKEDRAEAINNYLERQHYFRGLVMRKSDGSSVHLGTGVRKHGKRH